MILEKIDKTPQTLRDIVQARTREAILDGRFAPGTRLIERSLCEQLGVSRTVVRETIRYLEAEGLVENIPNRGPIVATLSREQAKQIYDIRLQLEGAAAAACAERHKPEFRKKLGQALTTLKDKLGDTEWSDLLLATTGFYELIFMEAGHDIAWDVVQRLNGRISRLRAMTIADRNRDTPGIAHMIAIHDGILTGDPVVARKAVERHLSDAAKIADRFLRDQADPQDA